jgi:hypothetical protein
VFALLASFREKLSRTPLVIFDRFDDYQRLHSTHQDGSAVHWDLAANKEQVKRKMFVIWGKWGEKPIAPALGAKIDDPKNPPEPQPPRPGPPPLIPIPHYLQGLCQCRST